MRGVRRTPYRECLTLLGWAEITWTDLRGRARRDGIPHLGALTAADMIGILMSYLIDDTTSALVSRAEARDGVESSLQKDAPPDDAPQIGEWGHTSGIAPTRPVQRDKYPDRATWGLLPEHVAGLEAAMNIVGGPGGA